MADDLTMKTRVSHALEAIHLALDDTLGKDLDWEVLWEERKRFAQVISGDVAELERLHKSGVPMSERAKPLLRRIYRLTLVCDALDSWIADEKVRVGQ